jgi:pyruvate-ferredoxin/flavodoxin oxidoreductase
MAGEVLPGDFHVSARALASHALSIFGDHQDVMSTRATGCAMLATGSVQEVMDLAAVAHLASIKTRIPFVHFFDGFRTSHEVQKIEQLDNEDIAPLIDQEALAAFRKRALNPENPVVRGTAQNPDIYFQAREACNPFYDAVPTVVEEYMNELSKITGRQYGLFDYYGAPDADRVVVAMGSATEAIREGIDYLLEKGEKIGMIAVHLYRPFSAKHFLSVLPKTAKRICVLDRTKEPGAGGEPLYLDVKNVLYGTENAPLVVGGRYGLSSKDFTPASVLAIYENLAMNEPKNRFTVGIVDDVTFTSLPLKEEIPMGSEGIYEAKFYGLGADGTVGANKNSIVIIGDNTNKYCQAYFSYDSKKSGGFTCSHLRFGDHPIRSTYLVNTPNFVACHVPAYLHLYDVTKGLKKNGTFLLNSIWNAEETKKHLPDRVKKYLAENNITMYIINATEIAQEIGLGNRTNTILQSAFFKITGVIPYDLAVSEMKKFIVKSYGNKGEKIINMNNAAVDRGGDIVKVEIPAEWTNIVLDNSNGKNDNAPDFVKNIVRPVNALKGDDLPVSTFKGREDGTWEQGTTRYEKRGVAAQVPVWKAENCIQCNQCAYVCPHAAIRPFVLDANEQDQAPAGMTQLKATGKQFEGMTYRMQVDVLDCMGCGNCPDICPGNKNGKALEMVAMEEQLPEQANWDWCVENVTSKQYLVDTKLNVKNSQFATPLFEFSGACTGCGETPYIKLISQLFGDRQMIANATGCTSIYSASAPSTPYTKNENGRGPAWANSLFEDNAEFGLGMVFANDQMRDRLVRLMTDAQSCNDCTPEMKALFAEWIENRNDADKTIELEAKITPLVNACDCAICKEISGLSHYLVKQSQWIIGGDGWAYDIGFGGLDHVIATGKNVNILVVDTEVYSNTGGQASKSTPKGAVAKFAASGKRVRKKDLGMIAATYGYVYVAQIAMGANQAQTLKAIREAEAYDGPSIVIAYSPCIAHGLRAGMNKAQDEQKRAVECGYWQLYRYNPELAEQGQNPMQLDSKEPDWAKFQEFLQGEVRYTSLVKQFPAEAKELFAAAEKDAKWRYANYKRMSEIQF